MINDASCCSINKIKMKDDSEYAAFIGGCAQSINCIINYEIFTQFGK